MRKIYLVYLSLLLLLPWSTAQQPDEAELYNDDTTVSAPRRMMPGLLVLILALFISCLSAMCVTTLRKAYLTLTPLLYGASLGLLLTTAAVHLIPYALELNIYSEEEFVTISPDSCRIVVVWFLLGIFCWWMVTKIVCIAGGGHRHRRDTLANLTMTSLKPKSETTNSETNATMTTAGDSSKPLHVHSRAAPAITLDIPGDNIEEPEVLSPSHFTLSPMDHIQMVESIILPGNTAIVGFILVNNALVSAVHGVVVAVGFRQAYGTGTVLVLAFLLYFLPQQASDCILLRSEAGWSKPELMKYLATSLPCVATWLVTVVVLNTAESLETPFVGWSAGFCFYFGLGHLAPFVTLWFEQRAGLVQLLDIVGILLGVFCVLAANF